MVQIKKVEAKGIKYHQGHEGEPLAQCNIYINGKKACFYSDGDWGGPIQIDWSAKAVVTEQEFSDWVDAKKLVHFFGEGQELKIEMDLFLNDIVAEAEKLKDYKKMSKKSLVFRLIETRDKVMILDVPYSVKTDGSIKAYFFGRKELGKVEIFVDGEFKLLK